MINTAFDVYSDTPRGKDPDSHSATLRSYHRQLWSKPLPAGGILDLQDNRPTGYLLHRFADGTELALSSDSIGHSYRSAKSMAHIIEAIPKAEIDQFFSLCSTIGAYMIFPARKIDGRATINGARGMHAQIKDRFDLTLECIRRHFHGEKSPLDATLARYANFFALFGSFSGYVDYFLLQDLVVGENIRFVLPFDGFDGAPLPKSVAQYRDYRDAMTSFIQARNSRIASWEKHPCR